MLFVFFCMFRRIPISNGRVLSQAKHSLSVTVIWSAGKTGLATAVVPQGPQAHYVGVDTSQGPPASALDSQFEFLFYFVFVARSYERNTESDCERSNKLRGTGLGCVHDSSNQLRLGRKRVLRFWKCTVPLGLMKGFRLKLAELWGDLMVGGVHAPACATGMRTHRTAHSTSHCFACSRFRVLLISAWKIAK